MAERVVVLQNISENYTTQYREKGENKLDTRIKWDAVTFLWREFQRTEDRKGGVNICKDSGQFSTADKENEFLENMTKRQKKVRAGK